METENTQRKRPEALDHGTKKNGYRRNQKE